ncbi:hypothetical protein TCAL_04674 [Tigriopus californicus]|uniref:SSD domain-containing protein n=1 Tax=Tigriopus californicus TaxID=6832 RepID=A0A553NTP5_TIGCA|nr:hypothetical protein TCAL_04674 [Tigriopus californicus]
MMFVFTLEERNVYVDEFTQLITKSYNTVIDFYSVQPVMFDILVKTVFQGQTSDSNSLKCMTKLDEDILMQYCMGNPDFEQLYFHDRMLLIHHNFPILFGFMWSVFCMPEFLTDYLGGLVRHLNHGANKKGKQLISPLQKSERTKLTQGVEKMTNESDPLRLVKNMHQIQDWVKATSDPSRDNVLIVLILKEMDFPNFDAEEGDVVLTDRFLSQILSDDVNDLIMAMSDKDFAEAAAEMKSMAQSFVLQHPDYRPFLNLFETMQYQAHGPKYETVFPSPWAPSLEMEQRHKEMFNKVQEYPKNQDGSQVDKILFMLTVLVSLMSVCLDHGAKDIRIENLQATYTMMLYRYLKQTMGTKAYAKLTDGLMIKFIHFLEEKEKSIFKTIALGLEEMTDLDLQDRETLVQKNSTAFFALIMSIYFNPGDFGRHLEEILMALDIALQSNDNPALTTAMETLEVIKMSNFQGLSFDTFYSNCPNKNVNLSKAQKNLMGKIQSALREIPNQPIDTIITCIVILNLIFASDGSSNLKDSKKVERIQNNQVFMLHRYLRSKFGDKARAKMGKLVMLMSYTQEAYSLHRQMPKDNQSVFRTEVWLDIMTINNQVVNLVHLKSGEGFQHLCVKRDNICLINDVLELFDYIQAIKSGTLVLDFPKMSNPVSGNDYFLPAHFGHVVLNPEETHLIDAFSMKLYYSLSAAPDQLNLSRTWEVEVANWAQSQNFTTIQIDVLHSQSLQQGLVANIDSAFNYLDVTVALVTLYITFNSMNSKFGLTMILVSLLGLLNTVLCMFFAFALTMKMGYDWQAINLASVFLLLGVGLDDTFVMLSSWRKSKHISYIPHRLSHCYQEAGVSITITSLTNIISFMIGALVPGFPCVEIFCVYAGSGLLAIYLGTLFIFGPGLAFLYSIQDGLLRKLPKLKKLELKCVTKLPTGNDMFQTYLGVPLTKSWTKVVVLIIWITYFTLAVIGSFNLGYGLEPKNLMRRDSRMFSYLQDHFIAFHHFAYRIQVIFYDELDYSDVKVQQEMFRVLDNIKSSPRMSNNSKIEENWLTSFLDSPFSPEEDDPPEQFIMNLKKFLVEFKSAPVSHNVKPFSSCMIVLAIISILMGILGGMFLADIKVDVISMINIIISIGFSVDFSAHITHHFISSVDMDPNERIKSSLEAFGMPIIQSALSTILGVMPLFFIDSYILQSFATMMTLVICLGTIHGLVFLPVGMCTFLLGMRYCHGKSVRECKPEILRMANLAFDPDETIRGVHDQTSPKSTRAEPDTDPSKCECDRESKLSTLYESVGNANESSVDSFGDNSTIYI